MNRKIVSWVLAVILSSNMSAWARDKGSGLRLTKDSNSPFSFRQPSSIEDLTPLVEEARERNPEIRAARARWLAAKKRIAQAWALPDPTAGLDVMGEMTETRVGPQDNRFVVSQKIPFPTKLWEKRRMAKEEARAMKERYLAIEREVLTQLKRAYYDLYKIDASIAVIEEIHELLKGMEKAALSRYASLAGAERDVAKAQAEVSLTLEDLLRLRQKRESVVAFINHVLDRDPLGGLEEAARPKLPKMERDLTELINLAHANRQEIKEKEALVEKEKRGKRLAQWQYLPDVEFGFSYTFVGSGNTVSPEDGKDSWIFPLRFTIPLWQNRIVPSIQEAQKKVEEARAHLDQAENETYFEVRDAYFRYQSGREISELYETAVIPQARLALTSDQAGYRAGTADFLNLLDSERVYLRAQLSHIKIFTEALKSYADLQRATGLDWIEEKEEAKS